MGPSDRSAQEKPADIYGIRPSTKSTRTRARGCQLCPVCGGAVTHGSCNACDWGTSNKMNGSSGAKGIGSDCRGNGRKGRSLEDREDSTAYVIASAIGKCCSRKEAPRAFAVLSLVVFGLVLFSPVGAVRAMKHVHGKITNRVCPFGFCGEAADSQVQYDLRSSHGMRIENAFRIAYCTRHAKYPPRTVIGLLPIAMAVVHYVPLIFMVPIAIVSAACLLAKDSSEEVFDYFGGSLVGISIWPWITALFYNLLAFVYHLPALMRYMSG